MKQQQTGMRGVFLVAAELVARGLIVSPTSRSAFGADLLVTDDRCRRAYSVQVKTNAAHPNFWLLNKRAKQVKSPSHVYVFVNLSAPDGPPEYFVVPSRVVAKRMHTKRRRSSTWYAFWRDDALRYRNKWAILGGKS